jgi:hypothetical protein
MGRAQSRRRRWRAAAASGRYARTRRRGGASRPFERPPPRRLRRGSEFGGADSAPQAQPEPAWLPGTAPRRPRTGAGRRRTCSVRTLADASGTTQAADLPASRGQGQPRPGTADIRLVGPPCLVYRPAQGATGVGACPGAPSAPWRGATWPFLGPPPRSRRRRRPGAMIDRHGEWRSLVAHPAGGRAAAGSNPVSPMQEVPANCHFRELSGGGNFAQRAPLGLHF